MGNRRYDEGFLEARNKVAPENPIEDLKGAVNAIGSLVRVNALRRETDKLSV
ncbi:hypothetical protein RND71_005252 [Anisodus tanguticus]|uniref:Uncharacterized protein n=1 Tax=Anisodus tanguticus TaxID=243964 RepID=A0AAE1VVD0_9SOLA|nr:hypothetical protein RND71_005252 [Anisodus tanguticus]